MFIPVADETDVYDASGRQIDDVNTSLEYVDQVILGNTGLTPEDGDDDQAHFFTGSAGATYYLSDTHEMILSRDEPTTRELAIAYPLLQVHKMPTIAYDILTPPPEA